MKVKGADDTNERVHGDEDAGEDIGAEEGKTREETTIIMDSTPLFFAASESPDASALLRQCIEREKSRVTEALGATHTKKWGTHALHKERPVLILDPYEDVPMGEFRQMWYNLQDKCLCVSWCRRTPLSY